MFGRTAIRIARIVGGVVFLIIGVIGLFLPFIQGILCLVIGLSLLSQESERARLWSEWLREHMNLKKQRKVEGPENDR